MLHLLPLRLIAKVLLYVTTFGILGSILTGLVAKEHIVKDAFPLIRYVLAAETIFVFAVVSGWRYIPGFLNRIYPDISGTWKGFIYYYSGDEEKSKEAFLHVHQGMTKIRLILETDESQSETIVALPEKDEDFSRFRLFYIFQNTRREGVSDRPSETYRGTAFIEMGPGKPTTIDGSYFTDQKKTGSMSFSRELVGEDGKLYDRLLRAIKYFFDPRGVSPYLGSRKFGRKISI